MKTRVTAFSVLILLFASSCSEVDKLLTFSLSYNTAFDINDGLPIDTPTDVSTLEVTTDSSVKFNNNNTSADLVKNIQLQELKLTVTDPSDKTFSFLKSVHVYISTNTSDEIEVAYLDNISTTSNTINLNCTSRELDKYVKEPSYRIRTSVTTKESLSQKVTVKADLKFKVTANPFN